MDIAKLKRIFDFLEEKENKKHKDRDNFIWRLKFNETLTKEDLVVNSDLNLFGSNLTSLPKGLKVRGYLDLSYSKIISLPEGLEVSGELNLTDTELTSLPKGLEVWGNLDTTYTPLAKYTYDELIAMIKPGFIKGEIYN